MTREEAILLSAYTGFLLAPDFSEVQKFCEDALGRPIWTHEFADKDVQEEIQEKLRPQIMALIQNISALTPPTQEQMERVWPGCDNCTAGDGEFRVYCDKWGTDDYCGHCGRPLTPAAWEELRKRWEALNDGKGD